MFGVENLPKPGAQFPRLGRRREGLERRAVEGDGLLVLASPEPRLKNLTRQLRPRRPLVESHADGPANGPDQFHDWAPFVEDGEHGLSGQQVWIDLGRSVGRLLRAEDDERIALEQGRKRATVAEAFRLFVHPARQPRT